jgi:phage FluMu gp28-like protein
MTARKKVAAARIVSPREMLLPYQRRWVEDAARFKLGIWSRQSGKDFSASEEIVNDCYTTPKCPWLIAAPSERQSLETLAKVKEWTEVYRLAIADQIVTRESNHPEALMKSAEVVFSNGARVIAVPGKPDTVRGFSANVLLTEAAFFENLKLTWRAILPSITNPMRGGLKRARIITTPNGKGDLIHKLFADNYRGPGQEADGPLDPKRLAPWSVHRVTLDDAIKLGLPVNGDELRAAMDDPESAAQEFDLEFLDGSSVLLPYDIIALAESADAHEFCDPSFFQGNGEGTVVCGTDFGRTNDPTINWTLQRVGDVWVTREVLELRGMSSPNQQKILASRYARANRVCFDYTGPGIGLGDYLVDDAKGGGFGQWKPEAEKFGRIELCTFTVGFKREIFPKLRRAFESPIKVRVPISIAVREDLHAMKQIVRNGEYTYAAPRTAEGHSDRCTALALALRAAGTAGGPFSFQPCGAGTAAAHDGDDFGDHRREIIL